MSEEHRRSSSFSRPTAFSIWSERRELEHTSSPKYSVWWAGVIFWGFISRSSTGMPRRANCQAASLPARPAPITITGSMGTSWVLVYPFDSGVLPPSVMAMPAEGGTSTPILRLFQPQISWP